MVHILNLSHRIYFKKYVCAKVNMFRFTYRYQTYSQTFIQIFFSTFCLEKRYLVYLTVINEVLFGIVVFITMMFQMYLF